MSTVRYEMPKRKVVITRELIKKMMDEKEQKRRHKSLRMADGLISGLAGLFGLGWFVIAVLASYSYVNQYQNNPDSNPDLDQPKDWMAINYAMGAVSAAWFIVGLVMFFWRRGEVYHAHNHFEELSGSYKVEVEKRINQVRTMDGEIVNEEFEEEYVTELRRITAQEQISSYRNRVYTMLVNSAVSAWRLMLTGVPGVFCFAIGLANNNIRNSLGGARRTDVFGSMLLYTLGISVLSLVVSFLCVEVVVRNHALRRNFYGSSWTFRGFIMGDREAPPKIEVMNSGSHWSYTTY